MAISLIRIDDRMIHGQVVMSWIRHTSSQAIRLIDNKVANDDLMKEILLAAAPANLDVQIITEDEAVADFAGWEEDEKRVMVIVRSPQTLVRLMEGGIIFTNVNLGGLGIGPGKNKLFRNISASDEERLALKTLLDARIEITIQMVSTERRHELTEKMLK